MVDFEASNLRKGRSGTLFFGEARSQVYNFCTTTETRQDALAQPAHWDCTHCEKV